VCAGGGGDYAPYVRGRDPSGGCLMVGVLPDGNYNLATWHFRPEFNGSGFSLTILYWCEAPQRSDQLLLTGFAFGLSRRRMWLAAAARVLYRSGMPNLNNPGINNVPCLRAISLARGKVNCPT